MTRSGWGLVAGVLVIGTVASLYVLGVFGGGSPSPGGGRAEVPELPLPALEAPGSAVEAVPGPGEPEVAVAGRSGGEGGAGHRRGPAALVLGDELGSVRMKLEEAVGATKQMAAIVESLEVVATQRAAVLALLGESQGSEEIRAALGALRGTTGVPTGEVSAPQRPVRREPVWRPTRADLVYVQSVPARVMVLHRSGRRLDLREGQTGVAGRDAVRLDGVAEAGAGGHVVTLTVNGSTVELR